MMETMFVKGLKNQFLRNLLLGFMENMKVSKQKKKLIPLPLPEFW